MRRSCAFSSTTGAANFSLKSLDIDLHVSNSKQSIVCSVASSLMSHESVPDGQNEFRYGTAWGRSAERWKQSRSLHSMKGKAPRVT